jgi:hypothetical protein
VNGGAIFSPCGRYRYRLDRDWAVGRRVVGLLLNPSKATAEHNDSTVGTFTSFARRWGYAGFSFVNLFALCSTDPMGLVGDPAPIGPENDRYIVAAVAAADLVVVAWGSRVPIAHRGRVDQVLELIGPTVPLWCLGVNMNGAPKHPLRIPHSTPLVRYYPSMRAA